MVDITPENIQKFIDESLPSLNKREEKKKIIIDLIKIIEPYITQENFNNFYEYVLQEVCIHIQNINNNYFSATIKDISIENFAKKELAYFTTQFNQALLHPIDRIMIKKVYTPNLFEFKLNKPINLIRTNTINNSKFMSLLFDKFFDETETLRDKITIYFLSKDLELPYNLVDKLFQFNKQEPSDNFPNKYIIDIYTEYQKKINIDEKTINFYKQLDETNLNLKANILYDNFTNGVNNIFYGENNIRILFLIEAVNFFIKQFEGANIINGYINTTDQNEIAITRFDKYINIDSITKYKYTKIKYNGIEYLFDDAINLKIDQNLNIYKENKSFSKIMMSCHGLDLQIYYKEVKNDELIGEEIEYNCSTKNSSEFYINKYVKYKNKYLELKNKLK